MAQLTKANPNSSPGNGLRIPDAQAVAAFSPGILHPPALKNPSENSCSHVLPVHLRGHAGIVKKLTETFSEGQQ
jgi:hypothetical protein